MRSKFQASCLVVLMSLLAMSSTASAMPAGAEPPADPMAPPPATSTSPEPVVYATQPQPQPLPQVQLQAPMDRPRFRFGISGGAGGEWVAGLSGVMYGMDLRLGVQINHLVGAYLQQHLSFGKLTNGVNYGGYTGTYVATAMVDFTFSDHLVAGAGVGYGVLNNPSGPALAFRAAYYPVATTDSYSPRRKGLMLGLDLRTVFAGAGVGTGVVITGSIGYEAF